MTASLHPLPRGDPEPDAALSCAVALRDYLRRAKQQLDEQIRAYPKPIPRCDAQFNYLYEQRNRLSTALDEASAIVDGGSDGPDPRTWVASVLCSAPWSDDAQEREMRRRLRERIEAEPEGIPGRKS